MAEEKKKGYFLQIVVVIALVIGVYFIIRQNRISKQHHYYAYFNDIQGLQPSSQVQINGVRVGKIASIDLNGGQRVKVLVAVNKDIIIKEGTIASLASGGFTGEKIIELQPANNGNILAEYATIKTQLDSTVMPMSVRITPMIETAKLILASADVGLRGFSYAINGEILTQSAKALIAIDNQTSKLSNITGKFNADAGNIVSSIQRANASTTDMAANTDDLSASIKRTEASTGKAAKNTINENFKKLRDNFSALGTSLRSLNTIDTSWANDKRSYRDISKSLDTTNKSLKETYQDPPGISIFGGKKKNK